MIVLKLPDVTLVCIETREHALMRLAIKDTVSKVQFGEAVILTDRPEEYSSLGCTPRFHVVPDWPDKMGWCRAAWFDVPPLIRTPYILFLQWDAGILDVGMWRDEFLEYDFIGAPWTWHDSKRVGNTGFAIKSTRLARYVSSRRDKYPCNTNIEDDLLCRTYRPQLEEAGFVWAPERVAHDFAYEGCGPGNVPKKHFGFHAAFNFRLAFDHDQMLERGRLMMESPYIRDSYIMKNFCTSNPEIASELAEGVLRAAE